MSKLIYFKKETDTRARVYGVHHKPEQLSEEQKQRGVLVDSIPSKPEVGRGETAVRFINPETGDIWHEVEERELNEAEKQNELEERVVELEQEVSNLKKKP